MPVPPGKYNRLHLGLLATDGDMADLSRNLQLKYTDGSSQSVQLGPVADWFNSPMAYADAIESFDDRSTVQEYVNITPNVNDVDTNGDLLPFVITCTGSGLNKLADSRFMDGTAQLIYELTIPPELTQATLGIDMWNNFVVSLSKDGGATWEEVLNSFNIYGIDYHSGGNRKVYTVDLATWLADNPTHTIQVLFADGSTGDGWGPQVFNVVVYTGEIVNYTKRHTTVIDTSKATVFADFLTDGGAQEKNYLLDESSTAPSGQGHRFADGNGYIIYEVKLPAGTLNAKVAMNINGNFVVSAGPGGGEETLISIVPNVDDVAGGVLKPFVLEATGSALESRPNSRFMDGTSVLVYELSLPSDLIDASLKIDMHNNFVVGLMKETEYDFTEVLNSQTIYGTDIHDGSNRQVYEVDLAPWLEDNPDRKVQVRFTDGTTGDGWGPQVWKVLVTQGQPFSLTEVITAKGVTENSLVPYSGSGGQNKAYYIIDLSPYLAESSSATVRIKLTDGTPGDGWGPGIYRMLVFDGTLGIRTDGASIAGLQPTGGLPATAYANGANIVRREYALDDSKTLESFTLPTLVPSLGSKLYLMAATLESGGGATLQMVRNPNGTVTLDWNSGGTLQSAGAATGGWAPAASQARPQTIPAAGTQFFRVVD